VFGVVIPADCRTARHGRHALSLRVFIKQPRAGSLERDIVQQLGGGHHIAAALFPPQGTDALIHRKKPNEKYISEMIKKIIRKLILKVSETPECDATNHIF
jgi:hypothetical protein